MGWWHTPLTPALGGGGGRGGQISEFEAGLHSEIMSKENVGGGERREALRNPMVEGSGGALL